MWFCYLETAIGMDGSEASDEKEATVRARAKLVEMLQNGEPLEWLVEVEDTA